VRLIPLYLLRMRWRIRAMICSASAARSWARRSWRPSFAVISTVVSVQHPRSRARPRACPAAREALQPQHDRHAVPADAWVTGGGIGSWSCAAAGPVDDAAAGEPRTARAECRLARAQPRVGSWASPELAHFLPAPVGGPAPGPAAVESAAHGTEARWSTRPPQRLPCPAAGRAGGRDRGRGARAVPALWAAASW